MKKSTFKIFENPCHECLIYFLNYFLLIGVLLPLCTCFCIKSWSYSALLTSTSSPAHFSLYCLNCSGDEVALISKLQQLWIWPNTSVFQMLRNQVAPCMIPTTPWNCTSLKKKLCYHLYQFPEAAIGGVL